MKHKPKDPEIEKNINTTKSIWAEMQEPAQSMQNQLNK